MACVGILDSGVGGLTVWQAIKQQAPTLPCLYLADQAHLPYGPRSHSEIQRLSRAMTACLVDQGAHLIILACNTASAAALEHLRERFPGLPFVGMEPAVKPAALHTRSGVVGLMATRGTLKGDLLRRTAQRFAEHVQIVSSDCPGLAEAIEAGLDGPALDAMLQQHVGPMQARGADTIVLGCTHYPLIEKSLSALLGPEVRLINPAPAVARQALRLWRQRGLPMTGQADRFASTAAPETLQAMLRRQFDTVAQVEGWHWQNGRCTL